MLTVVLVGREKAEVKNLKQASKVFRSYFEELGLGASSMTARSGKVYDGKKCITQVSYNGRVWDKNDNEILV